MAPDQADKQAQQAQWAIRERLNGGQRDAPQALTQSQQRDQLLARHKRRA